MIHADSGKGRLDFVQKCELSRTVQEGWEEEEEGEERGATEKERDRPECVSALTAGPETSVCECESVCAGAGGMGYGLPLRSAVPVQWKCQWKLGNDQWEALLVPVYPRPGRVLRVHLGNSQHPFSHLDRNPVRCPSSAPRKAWGSMAACGGVPGYEPGLRNLTGFC